MRKLTVLLSAIILSAFLIGCNQEAADEGAPKGDAKFKSDPTKEPSNTNPANAKPQETL